MQLLLEIYCTARLQSFFSQLFVIIYVFALRKKVFKSKPQNPAAPQELPVLEMDSNPSQSVAAQWPKPNEQAHPLIFFVKLHKRFLRRIQ
jgi:hypothetical protein